MRKISYPRSGEPAERQLRDRVVEHLRGVLEDDRRRVRGDGLGRAADHGRLMAFHVDLDQRDRLPAQTVVEVTTGTVVAAPVR